MLKPIGNRLVVDIDGCQQDELHCGLIVVDKKLQYRRAYVLAVGAEVKDTKIREEEWILIAPYGGVEVAVLNPDFNFDLPESDTNIRYVNVVVISESEVFAVE